MISLYDAQITDILPEYLKKSDDVKALSYAVSCAMQRAIDHSRNISVCAAIDTLPENILDLLALELNTQYYDDSASVYVKRELIKNTLKWYQHTGTPAAVEEAVAAVFGNGTIEEWFEYGGEPYHFKINTSTMNTTDDMVQRITKAISSVQSVRSYLEEVVVEVIQQMPLYFGSIPKVIMDTTTLGIDMNIGTTVKTSESLALQSDMGVVWLFTIENGKIMIQEAAEQTETVERFPYLMDVETNRIYELAIMENKLVVQMADVEEAEASVFFSDIKNQEIRSLYVSNEKLYLM